MDTGLTLHRTDGHQAACYRWSHGGAPRAVLVVAHGMGEHALRYRQPLAGLIDSGVIVYAIDHRGHGATMALNGGVAGDFGPDGFVAVVEDLAALVRQAQADHPDLPLFLLGHSMGSFIAQAFLIDHAKLIDGAVLVGTTAVDRLADAMAREPDAMTALNRPFEPARTPCDWLSRDPAQVDAYLADPLCGFALVPDSMVSLFSQGERLADPKALARIPTSLPLAVLVGGSDVLITHFGALEPLVDRYRAVGLDPEVTVYPDARHEILNETNRDEVTTNLSIWIDRMIEAHPVHA